jgi:hypothetical protein
MGFPKRSGADNARGGPLSEMMSAEEYQEAWETWDYGPGEDSCPLEPKADDWGWFNGRMVALDYSTPAWEDEGP